MKKYVILKKRIKEKIQMKRIVKILSLVMAMLMLIQAPIISSGAAFDAPTLSQSEWDSLIDVRNCLCRKSVAL